MNADDSERALLQLIDDDLQAQREQILSAASRQARATLTQAHREARTHVRATLDDARSRQRLRIQLAQAQRQTRVRLAEQDRTRHLLAAAWQHLPLALLTRWRSPALRERWINAALATARSLLDAKDWTISYAELPPSEALPASTTQVAPNAKWHCVPDLRAGLRIAHDGNVVDASLAGMLADADALTARLLQQLERDR
jgi:hypothetical protein